VPVRADTRVALAFQGLTGLAEVALTGGAADAAALFAYMGVGMVGTSLLILRKLRLRRRGLVFLIAAVGAAAAANSRMAKSSARGRSTC